MLYFKDEDALYFVMEVSTDADGNKRFAYIRPDGPWSVGSQFYALRILDDSL